MKGVVVTYLKGDDLGQYRVSVENGRILDAKGAPFNSGEDGAHYVMDRRGTIYARPFSGKERFFHSSFFAGKPVAGADMMYVDDGELITINNQSGHYRLKPDISLQIIDRLRQLGIEAQMVLEDAY